MKKILKIIQNLLKFLNDSEIITYNFVILKYYTQKIRSVEESVQSEKETLKIKLKIKHNILSLIEKSTQVKKGDVGEIESL